MAEKRDKDLLTRQVNIRLTQAEYDAFTELAEDDRRSLSSWCRIQLCKAAGLKKK